MQYCPNCQLLSEGRCERCRGRLREPLANDPVLLMQGNDIQTAIAVSLLEAEKIPYSKLGRMGAGLSMYTGGMLEEYSVYVPYGAWEAARELVAAMGASEEETGEQAQTPMEDMTEEESLPEPERQVEEGDSARER